VQVDALLDAPVQSAEVRVAQGESTLADVLNLRSIVRSL
jgi:hypothetical protein